ncbi:hypothetical protein [Actinophytocola sp.]|uniref:hypothetical protein n=1 Tax=Actinophytocola sp. TaxID=1872138 RepID=UPI002ED358C4
MAEPISDEHVASVLRAFVRSSSAMIPRMAEARWLGPPKHANMSAEVCSAWWVRRVGRLTSLAASVPGLLGALGDRLPLQDILGAAGQGLLLCAIASEHGVHDQSERVRLLASVLFDRDLDPSAGATTPAPAPPSNRRLRVRPAAKWLWRQGRLLLAIRDELEKRPHGRVYHRALGMLPVVGMAGDYLGERSALKRAARAADRWLHAQTVQSGQ